MREIIYKVTNPLGVHARCASLFAQSAVEWKSAVTLTAKGKTVNGKQVLDILGLTILCGDEVSVRTEGVDEAEAMENLAEILPKLFS